MDGEKITEDGILDFAFGDYSSDEEGRSIHVFKPRISTQFISKLVKAAGVCKSPHKLEVYLTIDVDLDIDDFVEKAQQSVTKKGLKVWKLDFVGLPSLHVHFVPPEQDDYPWYNDGTLWCWWNATPLNY